MYRLADAPDLASIRGVDQGRAHGDDDERRMRAGVGLPAADFEVEREAFEPRFRRQARRVLRAVGRVFAERTLDRRRLVDAIATRSQERGGFLRERVGDRDAL